MKKYHWNLWRNQNKFKTEIGYCKYNFLILRIHPTLFEPERSSTLGLTNFPLRREVRCKEDPNAESHPWQRWRERERARTLAISRIVDSVTIVAASYQCWSIIIPAAADSHSNAVARATGFVKQSETTNVSTLKKVYSNGWRVSSNGELLCAHGLRAPLTDLLCSPTSQTSSWPPSAFLACKTLRTPAASAILKSIYCCIKYSGSASALLQLRHDITWSAVLIL